MEINDRVLFDASAYVLFEATGDSEAQQLDGDLESQHSDAAEEDALSCSYVRSGKEVDGGDNFRPRSDFDFDDWIVGGDDDGGGVSDLQDGGGVSDLEDGVVDQRRQGGKAVAPNEKVKGCCEKSSVKVMSEREGDRLFWEACLASHE
ncbi:hypothetical protein CASFOL_010009 [Castilleja foliolosa]|uniref:Uncharacterized protein n=1 Tax=Castilleja foliolosa TaxID=1961234 RepID=A0ABD3DVB7_9LAMI